MDNVKSRGVVVSVVLIMVGPGFDSQVQPFRQLYIASVNAGAQMIIPDYINQSINQSFILRIF